MSESLYEKARRLLGRPVVKAVDPDDADRRVDDTAEPTEKKLEEAGEEAAAGGQGDGQGGVPTDPGAGGEGAGPDGSAAHEGSESAETEQAEGNEEGGDDDHEDMDADEVRELRKAFGLTDFDDVADTKKSANIAGMLGQILSHMQKTDAFMQSLTQELADLKSKHSSGSADEDLRVTMKAVDTKIDALQSVIDNLYKTAPAAAAPKGFAKAVAPEQQPSEGRLSATDLQQLAMSGKLSALEIARLNRMTNHNSPANAGI